jgi:hypothetical protein
MPQLFRINFHLSVLNLWPFVLILIVQNRFMSNPKENQSYPNELLLEYFRRKGYQCKKIKEDNATVIIIRHEKKKPDSFLHLAS